MNAIESMRMRQEELKSRGVSDVKFFFGKTSEKSASEVIQAASNVLDSILKGKYTAMPSIGDSRGKKAK